MANPSRDDEDNPSQIAVATRSQRWKKRELPDESSECAEKRKRTRASPVSSLELVNERRPKPRQKNESKRFKRESAREWERPGNKKRKTVLSYLIQNNWSKEV